MVAISLVLLATSTMGWKMYGMIAKKRFSSSVERLRSRLLNCRQLAMNSQSDWSGSLFFVGKQAQFSCRCVEETHQVQLSDLSLGRIEVRLNEELAQKISFYFSSTGDVHPQGKLQICSGSLEPVNWDLLELFSLAEGKKGGPAHPKDW